MSKVHKYKFRILLNTNYCLLKTNMKDYISPPSLQKGQTVHLISTARKIIKEDIDIAVNTLESWGLKIKEGKNLFSESGQFAGTDEQRADDLQEALNDPETNAIICVRGGYGTVKILDLIDFSEFIKNPKWLSGFSDVTALHTHLHKLNIQSIHSTMPICFATDDAISIESLRKILFDEQIKYYFSPNSLNRNGFCEGVVIGGNLSLLCNVIGTESDINYDGKILFIEDTDEYLYHLDRMWVQLKRAGKLKNIAGLMVGQFSKLHDNEIAFGKTIEEIIFEAVKEYNFPVCYNVPIGHSNENIAIPCGRNASLNVREREVSLIF